MGAVDASSMMECRMLATLPLQLAAVGPSTFVSTEAELRAGMGSDFERRWVDSGGGLQPFMDLYHTTGDGILWKESDQVNHPSSAASPRRPAGPPRAPTSACSMSVTPCRHSRRWAGPSRTSTTAYPCTRRQVIYDLDQLISYCMCHNKVYEPHLVLTPYLPPVHPLPVSGADCLSLLVTASQLQGRPSLWCIWNFINVMYWQVCINSLCS
jgi:hypothetical protein